MARTPEEIYNALITVKESFPQLAGLLPDPDTADQLLADLESGSKVSRWRLLIDAVAFSLSDHEKLFDEHRTEVENRVPQITNGTRAWYHNLSLGFQYPDAWIYNGERYTYPEINPEKQIVQLASVMGNGGADGLFIRVAKIVNGAATPLEAAELSAFQSYLAFFMWSGDVISATSAPPDLFRIDVTVKYDPLILNADGSLLTDPAVFPVIDKIKEYANNIDFSGVFRTNHLVDYMQRAEGVVDPVINTVQTKPDAGSYANVTNGAYPMNAGYINFDEIGSTITYSL